jgi:hypothetical protein
MSDQTNAAPRTCANCACFAYMLPDGSVLDSSEQPAPDALAPPGTVCRRSTPGAQQRRMDVPVHDPQNGSPVLDRQGRQRMESRLVMQIGYPFTLPTAVCFDGWRPLGTLPGERIPPALPPELRAVLDRAAATLGIPPTVHRIGDPTDFQRIPDGT